MTRAMQAVLIALAPLGARGRRYVDIEAETFDADHMLNDQSWSSGERRAIQVAGTLWNGDHLQVDLEDLVCGLDGPWFQAFVDAIAARRGGDIRSDIQAALTAALEP